jgi:hypothetical protein
MASQSFFVPVGTPVLFRPGGQPYSFCAQPGAAGSVLIDESFDNGFTFVPSPVGSINTPYSFNNQSSLAGVAGVGTLGLPIAGPSYAVQGTIVRCTASVAQATFIASDVSVPRNPGDYEKITLVNATVAYTMPSTASEQTLFSMRLHPGFFNPVYSAWRMEIDIGLTVQNTANAKTLKCYIGPTNYSSATQLEGGTSLGSQLATSFSGFRAQYVAAGRGDNQTIIGSTLGSAGGFGGNVTANVTVSSANYAGPNAVEQVVSITGTKATAGETFTLDTVKISLVL